jgi:hypothetical protein
MLRNGLVWLHCSFGLSLPSSLASHHNLVPVPYSSLLSFLGKSPAAKLARAVYSNTSSAAYTVYREDQWQRRSKHTETES